MRTRTAFEEDEDEIPHHGDDREVTLSPTTVLLIFFGLVLVCGLCFGLGYSLGHRSTPEGAESAPVQQTPLVASSSSQPKPSAAAVTPAPVSDTPASPASDASSSSSPSPDDTEAGKPHEAAATPKPAPQSTPKPATDAKPVLVAQTQIKPALAQPAPAQTAQPLPNLTAQATSPAPRPAATTPAAPAATPATTPTGTIMVQVAAISNPTDAQVLVGALRRHGYSASVHNQPTDSLLHVQVGPFATRAEAFAMKQKLLSDGYNAILK